jgi:hypothetical protein
MENEKEVPERVLSSSLPIWVPVARWLARLWAALLVLGWLSFVIGKAHGNLLKMFLSSPLLTTCMLCMVIGLALGWRRELRGGLLILVGIVGFGIGDGGIPAWPFLLPAISAAGYFLAWSGSRLSRGATGATV